MKNESVETLGKEELAVVNDLETLGFQHREAKMLVYLMVNMKKVGKFSRRDMEITTKLPQPSVSIGLKFLRERGMYDTRNNKITRLPEDVIIEVCHNRITEAREALERIQKLAKSNGWW